MAVSFAKKLYALRKLYKHISLRFSLINVTVGGTMQELFPFWFHARAEQHQHNFPCICVYMCVRARHWLYMSVTCVKWQRNDIKHWAANSFNRPLMATFASHSNANDQNTRSLPKILLRFLTKILRNQLQVL